MENIYKMRVETLKGMNSVVIGNGDEYLIDVWNTFGVPDEAMEDDFVFIAEDEELYTSVTSLFVKIVKKLK